MVTLSSAHLHRANCFSDPAAAELALELGGLPLALALAGAYINELGVSFQDYLRQYREAHLRLRQTSPEVASLSASELWVPLQLSIDYIKQESELSMQLLRLWAYFDNQDLWFDLLREGRPGGPEWLCQLTENKLGFNHAVTLLRNHGLVERNKSQEGDFESEGYGMHRIVHAWTVNVLNKTWNVMMAVLALDCVASHIPVTDSPNSWATQRRLMPHAARCWSFVEDGKISDDGKAPAFYRLGCLYTQQGKYSDAEKMYQRACHDYEKVFGPEHSLTLDVLNILGRLYTIQGRFFEATETLQHALRGFEMMLGTENLSTLSVFQNLGFLYIAQGNLIEADEMCHRALRGYEIALGSEHPSTLHTIHDLGRLYTEQGELDEAEKMYQRALDGYAKTLGLEHPSTQGTINFLSRLYTDQGKLDEAEKMNTRMLKRKAGLI